MELLDFTESRTRKDDASEIITQRCIFSVELPYMYSFGDKPNKELKNLHHSFVASS
jgi:hypothetical protein